MITAVAQVRQQPVECPFAALASSLCGHGLNWDHALLGRVRHAMHLSKDVFAVLAEVAFDVEGDAARQVLNGGGQKWHVV